MRVDGRHAAAAAVERASGTTYSRGRRTNIRTFVDPQDPTHVALVMDVADIDRVMAAMDTPEAAAAIDYDGVDRASLRILVER